MNKEEYKFKTVSIHKKDYVMVNERIKYFRLFYPDWSIETKIIELLEKDSIIIQAFIKDEKGCIRASGIAQEYHNSSSINKTSYVENCETSAIGRALGIMGIGIDTSIASAEEMKKVQELETTKQYNRKQVDKQIEKVEKKKNKLDNQKEALKTQEENYLIGNIKNFIAIIKKIKELATPKLQNKMFIVKIVEKIGNVGNWKELKSFRVKEWCKRLSDKEHEKNKEMFDRVFKAINEIIREETEEETKRQEAKLKKEEKEEEDLI